MKSFTTLNKVSKITNPNTKESVLVSKVQKDGTKRVFFKIEKDGKLVFKTMFARLGEAERNAKAYLNR
jgi:hypothetical protein